MNAIFRFEPNDLVSIAGARHVYLRAEEAGHVLRLHGSALETSLTHAEMARAASTADFVHQRGFFEPAGAFAREHSGVDRLADIPAKERPKVMWKLYWVEAALAAEAEGTTTRSDASLKTFIEAKQKDASELDYAKDDSFGPRRKRRAGNESVLRDPPRPRTLRNWIAIYEKSGCAAHALRDRYRYCGNREPRLAPEIYGILKEAVATYATEKRPTIVKVHETLELKLRDLNNEREAKELEALALPSLKRVRKAIKALPAFATYAGRRGLKAARKRYLLTKGQIVATRPGERVEMDEWTIHLHKLLIESGAWMKLTETERRGFAGRLTSAVAIDVATRCIVGISVGATATSALALTALRFMASDKGAVAAAAGCATPWDIAFSPEMIFTDGGSALTSDATVAAIRDLGSGHRVPPAEEPEKRPFIERFFGTLDLSFLPYFTGRTFSGIDEKGDYDPQLRASLSTEAFCKALVRWIVDDYHNTPHDGLGGETPRRAWLRLNNLYGVVPPPAADARRAIFGVELERKTSLRGVRLGGLHYADADLGEAILQRGLTTVSIRFDPDDLGAVSLRVGDKWRRLPCRMQGLAGVSWATWTSAAADLRARYANAAAITRNVVLDAIAAITAIAAEGEASVGITRLAPTLEEVERVETGLLAGFELPDEAMDDAGIEAQNPFERAIATGGAPPPPTTPGEVSAAAPEPPRRQKARRASFEKTPESEPPAVHRKVTIEDDDDDGE